MTYAVFHVKLTDRDQLEINAYGWDCTPGRAYMAATFKGDPTPALEAGMLKVAGVVAVTDLEHLFHDTNHIDRPWTENETVRWHAEAVRSTSVGDVVYDMDAEKWHIVADFGFKELDLTEAQAAALFGTLPVL